MHPTIFADYFLWHYFKAPKLMLAIWQNFFWFFGHLFLVRNIWRTIFVPWKRIVAAPAQRWNFEDWASAWVANLVSRLIGLSMKIGLIVFGLFLQLTWVVAGALILVVWLVVPWLLIATSLYGVSLII